MTFVAEHADALASIVESGGVDFTYVRTTQGTVTPGTETWSGSGSSSIAGKGILVPGRVQRYSALSLNPATMPTMLFVPNTYPLKAFTAEFLLPGDVVQLNGKPFTIRDVDTTAIDGNVILAYVIVSAGGE